jgi:alkylation response protein AidB-like acyl-CoA dehydrogenase
VQLTLSRELVAAAIADPTPTTVAMAKAHATAMAVDVAGTAMQLHGGIGYTWEGPVHVHLKRAALNRSLFGSPRAHRARLADRYRTGGAGDG